MKDVLVQIGRTAILCVTLGLVLYGALTYAVRFPVFAPAFGLVLSIACGWLAVSSIRYALRHRLIPAKTHSVARDEQTVLYWGLLGLEFVAVGGCIAVAVMSLMRLIETIRGPL